MKHLIPRFGAMVAVMGMCLHAQMPPGVQKEDWEEINFEFNSSALTDGFPSLLRLAELLQKNGGFRVKLDGHTDYIGSEKYNEKLSQRRAEAVKTFLEKYGARPAQIEVVPRGKRDPKVDNRTQTNRWINRRVQMSVLDQTGKTIGAGGVGEAIKAIQTVCPDYTQTLAEILKKLDKLDDINRALAAIAADNGKLRADLDALKGQQQKTQTAVAEVQAMPRGATNDEVKRTVTDALEADRDPRFAILGLNAGVDNDGKLTFTGRGRYFAPFREKFAIQAQGEFLHFNERKEGQFDLGLVSRFAKRGQAGVFSSFKHVSLFGMDNGATLGQFAGTLDYLFSRGRIGFFGTKGFLNNQVMNTRFISRNIFDLTYARIVDQAGASTAISLFGNSMIEANLGALFVHGGSNKPGGTVRFTQPVSKHVALTLEGGWNETYVSSSTNGRFVAGLLFGNFVAPKEYLASDKPVPVDIPRVRYELLTKRVRTGNDAPVADAGPDQIGVAAGTISLDGSASFDPDGDPITFQWDQVSGPAVNLTGRNTAKASFPTTEGQTFSFRLTVKDDHGSMSLARVSVSTREVPRVIVQRFTANPTTIQKGGTSILSWQVLNADEVEISGIGKVNNQGGTTPVSPEQTTTYRLTARNKAGEATDTVTVNVEQPPAVLPVRILSFRAAPASILLGESSNLIWETENAETVTIDGIGTVRQTGTTPVSPQETTTYRLTATNKSGSASSTAIVTVGARTPAPRILSFTGEPLEIGEGESSTLTWRVEGATEIEISGLGPQTLAGSKPVTPATTTTYILTARNAGGESTASVTIRVIPRVVIGSFTANPATTAKPGDTSRLTWETTNATEATISEVGSVSTSGSADVKPQVTTIYTLTAKNSKFTVTRTVTVTVTPAGPGGGENPNNRPPVIVGNVPEFLETYVRDHIWDFSGSTDADGDNLTFDLKLSGTTNIGNAVIINRGKGVFYIQLLGGLGDYTFTLTVSDGKGGTAVKSFRWIFQGTAKP